MSLFGDKELPHKVPLADQIAELRREFNLRSVVYAKWVELGSMNASLALRRQRRLQAAIDTLEQIGSELQKNQEGR